MVRRLLILAAPWMAVAFAARAQAISTTGIERDTRSDRSWRLTYDNDFFTATDRYFGIGV